MPLLKILVLDLNQIIFQIVLLMTILIFSKLLTILLPIQERKRRSNINGNLNDVQLILDDQDSGKEQFNDRLYIRGDVKSSDSNNSDFRNNLDGGGNDSTDFWSSN